VEERGKEKIRDWDNRKMDFKLEQDLGGGGGSKKKKEILRPTKCKAEGHWLHVCRGKELRKRSGNSEKGRREVAEGSAHSAHTSRREDNYRREVEKRKPFMSGTRGGRGGVGNTSGLGDQEGKKCPKLGGGGDSREEIKREKKNTEEMGQWGPIKGVQKGPR